VGRRDGEARVQPIRLLRQIIFSLTEARARRMPDLMRSADNAFREAIRMLDDYTPASKDDLADALDLARAVATAAGQLQSDL
jgi:hypothetical protein